MCREVVVLLFVWWWRTKRSLLFLPHPRIGPSQSAEGVWPGERVWLKGGSEAKGEEFVGFAERRLACVLRRANERGNEGFVKRVLVSRSEQTREETKAS